MHTHTHPLHIPLWVHVNCWFPNTQSYSQQYLLHSPWKTCKTVQAHSNLISLSKSQVTKKHKAREQKTSPYASWWTIPNIYHLCSMYYNCPFSVKRLSIARLNLLWFPRSWPIWWRQELSPNRTETAIWSFQNAKYDLEASAMPHTCGTLCLEPWLTGLHKFTYKHFSKILQNLE